MFRWWLHVTCYLHMYQVHLNPCPVSLSAGAAVVQSMTADMPHADGAS